MVVVDEEGYRRLPGWIALYRAATALALGHTSATVAHARRASDLLEPDDQPGHAAAAALLGLAAWTSGDLEAAHSAYAHCQAIFLEIGYLADVLGCATTLADIRVTQGRLREAMLTYQQSLERASAPDAPALRGTVDMYVGMAELHREQNDLDATARFLHRSLELGEHLGMPRSRYRWHVAMARLREAEGDLEAAVTLLDEAERSYTGDFAPDVRPVPAVRARVWIAQGRLEEVFTWLATRDLSPDDELTYLREFEHVTLARALLARYVRDRSATTYAEATDLLARLLDAATEGGRTGTVVEVLILQALAHQLHGDVSAALQPLERALTLGAPAGYARIFLDEGPTMVGLLETAAEAGIAAGYIRSLLAASTDPPPKAPGHPTAARSAASGTSAVVVEPLSEREHDVLRLLRTELGGPEIARELVLSLNTIRTHTRSIYAKLGVNNRRAAVRRAEELDLLPARPRRHE
jgi:LuxR family maltose regulon positive regulatory protein